VRLRADRRVDGTGRILHPLIFHVPTLTRGRQAIGHRRGRPVEPQRSYGLTHRSIDSRDPLRKATGSFPLLHLVEALSSLIPLRLGQPQGTSRDAALFAARFRSTPLSGDLVELGPVAIGEKRPGITLGLEMRGFPFGRQMA
jgi:hypothetical protein